MKCYLFLFIHILNKDKTIIKMKDFYLHCYVPNLDIFRVGQCECWNFKINSFVFSILQLLSKDAMHAMERSLWASKSCIKNTEENVILYHTDSVSCLSIVARKIIQIVLATRKVLYWKWVFISVLVQQTLLLTKCYDSYLVYKNHIYLRCWHLDKNIWDNFNAVL